MIFELVLVYVFDDVGRRWRDSDGGVRFVKRPHDIDRQIDFTRAVSGLDIYFIILFVIKTFAWKPTTTIIYIFVHLIRKNHNGIVLYWFSVTMVSHRLAERSYINIICLYKCLSAYIILLYYCVFRLFIQVNAEKKKFKINKEEILGLWFPVISYYQMYFQTAGCNGGAFRKLN